MIRSVTQLPFLPLTPTRVQFTETPAAIEAGRTYNAHMGRVRGLGKTTFMGVGSKFERNQVNLLV